MRNSKSVSFVLMAIIAMFSFACSSGKASSPSVEATSTKNEAPVPTQTPAKIEVPAVDTSLLDEPVEVPEGGFIIRPAKGYSLDISGGNVMMLAPGADPDVGPVFQVMGMLSEQEITAEDLFQQFQSGMGISDGAAQPYTIGGENGLAAEINGVEGDPDKRGKIFFAVADGKQQLIMLAGTDSATWADFSPLVDAVAASLEFTELVPAAPVSSMSSGRYIYTNRNVVRDLAEKDGVLYAATLGGLTAWQLDSGQLKQTVPTEGMGHISANAVTYCEIPEPRILVGTLQGVSIYDFNTSQWEQRDLFPADSNLANYRIERLFCDQANHRLIVGYSGVGILDLDSGEFQHYTDKDGLLWNSVTDITVQGSDIWVASGYKGIAKISNGQITTFSAENGMPDEKASALEFSADGTLWVGANSGLMSYKNGGWKLFGADSPAKLMSINELAMAPDGSLWAATAPLGGGRLCRFDAASGSCLEETTSPDNMPILALTTDPNGSALYGTSKGVFVNTNGEIQSLVTGDSLVSNYVDALATAPDGMLWVGTDSGVNVLDPANPSQAWQIYQLPNQSGMGGNWASAIAFAADGSAWMSIINGSATSFQNNQWQAFKDVYSYNAVAVDAQNHAWIADDSKGIVVLDNQGNTVMSLTTNNGLPSDNVQALLLDDAGTMWIGTNQGLAKYSDDHLTVVFAKDSQDIPNVYVRALALDPNGNLLIGTFTGVSLFDGQKAVTLVDFLKDGYNDARLTTLASSADGEVWIGTDKGLLHGSPEMDWNMMTTANGLLSNYISALLVDQYGAVWVGAGGSNLDGGGLLQIVR